MKDKIIKSLLKTVIATLFFAAMLFISAGRLDWWGAWLFALMMFSSTIIISFLMDPELLAERAGITEGAKKWDIVLAILVARLCPAIMLIVAGLDARFGWSQVPISLKTIAFILVALGFMLSDWAIVSNKYFSPLVRIQHERGHRVIEGGPYRYIRHPGYAGSILFYVAVPTMLDSWWALIPGFITIVITVIRTALEDRTLHEELKGYREYARKVKYRLIPGIW